MVNRGIDGPRPLVSDEHDLDGTWRTATAVRMRLKNIVSLATQRGALAVTLKPNALVLSVLEAEAAKLRAQGVEFVCASRLTL
jgi:polysaccharide deacetylase 2 family uncharacterized protein YibQ